MTVTRAALTSRELAILAGASIDKRGVRFELDGRILRAFRPDLAPFYRTLLTSPAAEDLFAAGLVRSWIVEDRVEGFDLVVESERVPVVTYPQEWPTAMLAEAGLVIARLGRALAGSGLGLLDAHPWNVLFDGPRGVWVDLGSVAPVQRTSDAWLREFRRHILVPLALHRLGWHGMADDVISEHRTTRAKALWERRLLREWFPIAYAQIRSGPRDPAIICDRLIAHLEGSKPRTRRGEWSGYEQTHGVQVGEVERYGPKQASVAGILGRLPHGRVLDVGANAGWFSELAVTQGHTAVAVDTDDVTLSALFRRASARDLPILPIRMDILWPTGSHGLGLAYPDAKVRLRSDYSMWLAVLHHFANRQGIGFEGFAATVDQFTRTAAIVEFIPREDSHVREWPIASQPWYDAEHLMTAMAPYFDVVETAPSFPSPRQIMLFRRSRPDA